MIYYNFFKELQLSILMLRKLLPLKPDPIMGLVSKFKLDPRPHKINLTIGELYYVQNNNKYLFDYQFIMNNKY